MDHNFYIGLSIVVGQSFIDAVSSLINSKVQKQILMIVAGLMNFAAYMFAPVMLVSPLSALSIMSSAIMATIFCKKLNIFVLLGSALCLLGTILIVTFAPKETQIERVWNIAAKFDDPGWTVFVGLLLSVNLLLIFYVYPKWGSKIPFIATTIAASFASIAAIEAVGVGISIKRSVQHSSDGMFPYQILALMLVALFVSIIYMNKGVKEFGANIVAPSLYVEFVVFSIIGSAIVYKEWSGLEYHSIIAIVLGLLNTTIGVILISSFKLLESGSTNCLRLIFLNVISQRVSSSKQNDAGQHGVFCSKPADVFAATSLLGFKQELAATSTNTETTVVMETGKHTIGVGTFKITDKQRRYVNDVLNKERLSYGPYTQKFEAKFAAIHDCRFGVMTNSGTCCLQIALAALKNKYNWSDGDEVIVPAVTFVATANIVIQLNMKPVFVDVDPLYYEIDPNLIEPAISKRTRCIIPVHLFGQPCDMDRICAIAEKHNLRIIEDSCESMFVKYKGKSVGAWSDIGCFSTYIAHILSTGVGGLCTTQDPELAISLRSLMNHGRDSIYLNVDDDKNKSQAELEIIIKRRFRFIQMGYSYRVTELETALGLAQLEDYETMMQKRWQNGQTLINKLKPLSNFIQTPAIREGAGHAFMMFPVVVRHAEKDKLVNYLEAHGIETRDMLPLTNQPVYKTLLGTKEEDYPVAHWINKSGFYIGSHQNLTDADINHVVNTFFEYFEKTK